MKQTQLEKSVESKFTKYLISENNTMPIYNFKCKSCDHEFEHSCKIAERAIVEQADCPKCDIPELKQILSKVNFSSDPLGHSKVPMAFKEGVLDRLPSVGSQKGGRRESRLNFEK